MYLSNPGCHYTLTRLCFMDTNQLSFFFVKAMAQLLCSQPCESFWLCCVTAAAVRATSLEAFYLEGTEFYSVCNLLQWSTGFTPQKLPRRVLYFNFISHYIFCIIKIEGIGCRVILYSLKSCIVYLQRKQHFLCLTVVTTLLDGNTLDKGEFSGNKCRGITS